MTPPIIRPPVLNVDNTVHNPQPSSQPVATPGLETLITNIVNRVCANECRNLVQSIIDPDTSFQRGVDQTIDDQHRANLSDLDKVPDVVRSLREFSGTPGEFSSWRKSVERILNIYDQCKGTPKYFGILNTIRNKIVGNADAILESYNTPLNWECISKCLTLHYADRRDLGTLEYQMTTLVQGNNTVENYYQSVYNHLSLIQNKIASMNLPSEALYHLTSSYREKALDTFIRGLRGDLPRLLGIREPADLPTALNLCLKLENQQFRANYAYHNNGQVRKPQTAPPLPPRKNYNQAFYPQLAHLPQLPPRSPPTRPQYNPFQRSQQPPFQSNNQPNYRSHYQSNPYNSYQNQQSPNPLGPKPAPRPEPMETTTIRTNNVNYMNRPQLKNWPPAPKRPMDASRQFVPPTKLQRNFHVHTSEVSPQADSHLTEMPTAVDYQSEIDDYSAMIPNMTNQSGDDQSFDEYVGQQDNYEPMEQYNDFVDVHFLG